MATISMRRFIPRLISRHVSTRNLGLGKDWKNNEIKSMIGSSLTNRHHDHQVHRRSHISHWFFRPSRHLQLCTNEKENNPTVIADKEKFQVIMNVSTFEPREIQVKVIDEVVEIAGSHEEAKGDYEWVSRHFVQRYVIPRQCDSAKITTSLSPEGVLKVTIPRRPESEEKNRERVIAIEREVTTGIV